MMGYAVLPRRRLALSLCAVHLAPPPLFHETIKKNVFEVKWCVVFNVLVAFNKKLTINTASLWERANFRSPSFLLWLVRGDHMTCRGRRLLLELNLDLVFFHL